MARVHNKFLTATTGQMQLGGTVGVDYTALTAAAPIDVPVTWTPFGQSAQRVNSSIVLQPCEFAADRFPGLSQPDYLITWGAALGVVMVAVAWRVVIKTL